MNNLVRKETENRLFEIICSEIDVFSNAHNIHISRITNSVIKRDEVVTALDNLVKSNQLKNVKVDINGYISCQMTINGLEKLHDKVNK